MTHSKNSENISIPTDAEAEQLIRQLLLYLGENPDREGLVKTPERVIKAMRYLTSGYHLSAKQVVEEALFAEQVNQMVLIRAIEFYSLCEHHMLPFFGLAHVAYIPGEKITGLSKIARVVDVFARRLQVQERLTNEVADALMDHLGAKGVAVVMSASHSCMMMRGVQKQQSSTVTSAMRGLFASDPRTRSEFMALIRD